MVDSSGHGDVFNELIPFGYYSNRKEIRIQTHIQLQVLTDAALKYVVQSQNVSVTGLQILFDWICELQVGESLQIQFAPFESAPTQSFGWLPYQIVGCHFDYQHKKTYYRLALLQQPSTEPFEQFLGDFIHHHKHRYRIDVDDDIREYLSAAYQQLYAPLMTGIQFFTNARQSKPPIDVVVFNGRNKQLFSHFINPAGEVDLTPLLTESRLARLLQQGRQQSELVLYTFSVGSEQQTVHYCATARELKAAGLTQSYIAFGVQQPSWRIYKVLLTPSHQLSDHQIARSTAHLDAEPLQAAQQLLQQIQQLTHNGCFFDVTAELSARIPQLTAAPAIETLSSFICHFEQGTRSQFFQLGREIQRQEQRHQHSTSIAITAGQQQLNGKTLDFSLSGIRVQLETPCSFSVGDEVFVEFVHFQQKFKKIPLRHLSHRVVAIKQQGQELALKRIKGRHETAVRDFFQRLIEHNVDKLPLDFADKLDHVGDELLQALVCETVQTLPFFIQKQADRQRPYGLGRLVSSAVVQPLFDFFRVAPNEMDFTALNDVQLLQQAAQSILKYRNAATSFSTELYVYRRWQAQLQRYQIVYLYPDLSAEPAEKQAFLQQALSAEQYFLLKVVMVPCKHIKPSQSNELLQRIRRAVVHKADMLQAELQSVVAMAELIDLSKEIRLREGI